MLTCIIKYEIDPFKRDKLEEYARRWGDAIPAAGAELIGYFSPHEGNTTTAFGIYNVQSLADYEAYRARLAASEAGRENHEFAKRERFIRREDRAFYTLAPGAPSP